MPRWLVAVLALSLAACSGAGEAAPAPTSAPASAPPVSTSTAAPAAPTATPQPALQGKIAFSRGHDIWVYAGGGQRQATTLGSVQNPSWSPDGSQLAFDRAGKNSADLYLMLYPDGQPRALTSNASNVVDNNFWEMQPSWSPEGASLVYASDRGRLRSGTLDLAVWRMTIASKTRVQLSGANLYTGGVDYPSVRPDNASQVMYTSWTYLPNNPEAFGQLELLDIRTGRADDLSPEGETAMQASWSPDGKYIAYVHRQGGADQVWIMGAPPAAAAPSAARATPATATSSPDALLPVPRLIVDGVNAHPVWSPRGDALAFVSLDGGSFDLAVQALNPSLQPLGSPVKLTRGAHVDAGSSISWAR